MSTMRRLILTAFGVIVAIAVTVFAGRLVLTTKSAQTYLTERALNLINTPGQLVAVAATDGDWPGNIVLSGITISDRQGVWLSVNKLTLKWHPSRLLLGQIDIEALMADTVIMARVPELEQTSGPRAPFNVDTLIHDLENVQVDHLGIDAISLAPAVIGEGLTARATGRLGAAAGVKALDLELVRSDQPGHARITARAGPRAINFKLDAGTKGFSAEADISVTKPDDTLAGTLHVSRAASPASGQITMTLGGTRRDPKVAAAFDVRDFVTEGRPVARVAGAVRAQRTRDGAYALSGEGVVSDIRRAMPELAAVVANEARWTLKATQTSLAASTLDLFEVTAGDAALTVTGTKTGDEVRPASATLRVRGLGRATGIADSTSLTTVELTAERFTTAGEGNGALRATITHLPNKLPDLSFSARWNADDSALRISAIAGLAKGIKLTGRSTWPRQEGAIDHGASRLIVAADATALGLADGDPLIVTADLTGSLTSLKAQIETQSARLGPPAQELTSLTAKLIAARAGSGFNATVDAHANWRGAPATLTARASMAEAPEIAIDIQANSIAGRMDGELKTDTVSGLTTGNISANLDDIVILATAFGIDAAGALDAKMSFAPRGTTQRVEANLTVNNLATNPISASRVSMTAQIDDAWRTRHFEANLTATDGQLMGRPLTTLRARAAGTAAAYDVSLNAKSKDVESALLALRAHVAAGDTTTITFSQLALNDDTQSAALTAPATVSISAAKISIEAIAANVAGGTLRGNVAVARKDATISGEFEAKGIDAAALAPPGYPVPAGTLDGQIGISGPIKDASVAGRIAAMFPADKISAMPAFTLTAEARIGEGRLTTQATVEGLSNKPATLSAELPFRLDLAALRANVDMDAALAASMVWNGNIAPLWSLLPLDEHLLSGHADLNIRVSGTPGAPLVSGGVKVSGGRYENIAAGLVLRDIALSATTERGADLIVTLNAVDAGRGKIGLTGRFERDAQGAWTADLAGDLDRLAVLARDDVTAVASGKITYRGPLLAGLLKGNLAVGSAAIHLDSTGVPEVPLLRSFAALKADTFDVDRSVPPPAPIRLDLSLSMGDPLTVEGRGLESVWRGDLYVKGSISAPDIVGGLALERGTFAFLGQTFDLESGTVTFTGGGHIDPQLKVVAVREVTDITVMININGSAKAPTITLSSRPALPQDEVLARLLFNRNMGELGPLESIQLASAAADMSGLARGGISGVVKRTFGLDTFGFGGQSGSAVVVGRQVSRNIFVSVEQNVNNTSRLFTITWRLTRHFSLRSSASDQTGADLGLFWRKDY
jgi:translocation and assembly module TamB